jgi:integrase
MREAQIRKAWVAGELAAMRVPDLAVLAEPVAAPTLRQVADRWRQSRIDVSERTAVNHRVDLSRVLPHLGNREPASITPGDVTALVAALHDDGNGLKRETIRKTIKTFGAVLDFAGVRPNPTSDKTVRLPRFERDEVSPPTAAHVLAVHGTLPPAYRLPLLVLDATGMRVGELERLTWGDVDETAGRWRVSASVAKTRTGRWVPVPAAVFGAVCALVPREDRDLGGQVFAGFGPERFRTAITRACKATGTPLFSPHDLRHRRATLWHMGGAPAAEAAAWLGHSAQEHLRTYAHAALVDRGEIDYTALTSRLVKVLA